jgi:hypothetical protein
MTVIQSTAPARTGHATRRLARPIAGLRERMAAEGRDARLDEVLRAVVVNALGPDGPVVLEREEWRSIEMAIEGPVSAVARSAVEQLAGEVEATIADRIPELGRRLADHRLRVELGYD